MSATEATIESVTDRVNSISVQSDTNCASTSGNSKKRGPPSDSETNEAKSDQKKPSGLLLYKL